MEGVEVEEEEEEEEDNDNGVCPGTCGKPVESLSVCRLSTSLLASST